MPKFQPFDRHAAPSPKESFVTIQKDGSQITMNKASYEAMNRPEAVELNYDPDEQVIGLKPIEVSHPSAYRVRRMGNGSTFEVASRAFTMHWKINTGTARRYPARFEGGYLIIDLKQKGVDVTGPRARPRI